VDLVLLDEIDGTVIDRESGAAGYGSMIDLRDIFKKIANMPEHMNLLKGKVF
jgi:hypothetical protein